MILITMYEILSLIIGDNKKMTLALEEPTVSNVHS